MFEQLKQRDAVADLPSFAVFKTHSAPILLIALVLGFQQMDGYVSGTYVISFMKLAGIPLATIATVLLIARISDLFGVLVSGPGADLLHRKNTARIAILITVALAYPYARAIVERQVVRVAVLQCLITLFGMGIMHGLAPVLAAESFPTKFRYSGAGIAYGMSTIVGGMIAPPLLTILIGSDVARQWFYIPVVYGVYGVIALIALAFLRETAEADLHALDLPDLSGEVANASNATLRSAGSAAMDSASSD
jgi:MFS family permease